MKGRSFSYAQPVFLLLSSRTGFSRWDLLLSWFFKCCEGTHMRINILMLSLLCVLAPTALRADVADSAANGFTIKIVETIHATPAKFTTAYPQCGRLGGTPTTPFPATRIICPSTRNPWAASARSWLTAARCVMREVIFYAPAKALVLSGVFGPLQKFDLAEEAMQDAFAVAAHRLAAATACRTIPARGSPRSRIAS